MADGGGERLGGLPLADGAGGGAGGRPLHVVGVVDGREGPWTSNASASNICPPSRQPYRGFVLG
jgi:hypothetical protein